jgi:molecular chaperone DnaK (HSP70)
MSTEINPDERVAIGISFGNSYSSIGFTTSDGKAEVIANEDGDRQIPSILSYVEGEELHGTQAKAQLIRNPKNTVAYFRDFLGQEFKSIDPSPCHASAHPVQQESTIAFNIRDTQEEKENAVTVSEITTRHLKRLRNSASDYLGKSVNSAVITVPTNFSDAQKEALNKAAKEAGIEVLQFINEPVAAILAYDARPDAKLADKIIIVADLGGTRSDVLSSHPVAVFILFSLLCTITMSAASSWTRFSSTTSPRNSSRSTSPLETLARTSVRWRSSSLNARQSRRPCP